MDFINYIVLVCCCVSYSIQNEKVAPDIVENFIKTHHLRNEGYTDFTVSRLHLHHLHQDTSERLSSGDLRRLKRSEEYSNTPVHMNLAAFNLSFDVSLQFNHAMKTMHLPVVINTENGNLVEQGHIDDCYMTGMTAQRGPVSLSYCNGISGSIEDGEYLYRIDPLEPLQNGDNEQVLISKTLIENKPQDRLIQTWLDRELDDIPDSDRHRRKRAIPSTTLTIELCVFFDSKFVQFMRTEYNADTTQKMIDLVALKYNAAQATLSLMQEDIGYTVLLKLRQIQFWETDASWFTFDSSLTSSLSEFCGGIYSQTDRLNCDGFNLYTRASSPPTGYANIPGRCGKNNCFVSLDTNFYSGYITAHELGHNLNMPHDDNVGCGASTGLMAEGKPDTNSWTTCSLTALEEFLATPDAACLFTDDVSETDVDPAVNAVVIDGEIAGLKLTDDEMCTMREGSGWESLYWDNIEGSCTFLTCANMNPGPYYGTMSQYNFRMEGGWCGVGMACDGGSNCVPYADLRISNVEVIQGGWTEWGPVAPCSRTCGTGMAVKKRTCTNPKPKNAAPCEGPKYLGLICNTDPCPSDSTVATDLRIARATEVCTAYVQNNVLDPTVYDGTGDRHSIVDDKRCQVKCAQSDGFGYTKAFGFMPDGVDCSSAGSKWFPDANGLPRRSEYLTGLCLNGRCKSFGCDDTNSGYILDFCGVCGGANDTCTNVDGVDNTAVLTGDTYTLATLTAGTKNIQFYFIWSTMKKFYLEVYDTAGTLLVGHAVSSSTDNTGPITAAGVEWAYITTKQFVYTTGTLTEDVVIKVFNKDINTNTGIYYGYSLPLAATSSTTSTTSSTTTPTTTSSTSSTTSTTSTTSSTSTTSTTSTTSSTTTTTSPTTPTTKTSSSTTSQTDTPAHTQPPPVTSPTTDTPPTPSATQTSAVTATGTTTKTTTGNIISTTTNKYTCRWGKIRCGKDRCISFFDLCNGKDDCGNDADEYYTICRADTLAVSMYLVPLVILSLLKHIM